MVYGRESDVIVFGMNDMPNLTAVATLRTSEGNRVHTLCSQSFARVYASIKGGMFTREQAEELKRQIDLKTVPSIPEEK